MAITIMRAAHRRRTYVVTLFTELFASVLNWLERIPDRKVLVYHNITPTLFLLASTMFTWKRTGGREQLSRLKALTEAVG